MDAQTSRAITVEDAARLREALDNPDAQLSVGSQTVTMSEPLRRAVLQVVDELASGHDVAIQRVDTYLTTGQAAEMLHVSRPTVVKLCSEGMLEFEQPGTHRRISVASVQQFIDGATARRAAGLAEFAGTASSGDDQVVTTR